MTLRATFALYSGAENDKKYFIVAFFAFENEKRNHKNH